jgi:hypothetical protein
VDSYFVARSANGVFIILHGPHQSAQKSTMTGLPLLTYRIAVNQACRLLPMETHDFFELLEAFDSLDHYVGLKGWWLRVLIPEDMGAYKLRAARMMSARAQRLIHRLGK